MNFHRGAHLRRTTFFMDWASSCLTKPLVSLEEIDLELIGTHITGADFAHLGDVLPKLESLRKLRIDLNAEYEDKDFI